jgi:NADPH:quinone reductase
MQQIVVTKSSGEPRLVARDVSEPVPAANEILVDVRSISLNRGEVSRAFFRAEDGWTPGWDFAGVVARAAADASGPRAGERVVGFKNEGAWAERIAIASANVAVIPESLTYDDAATLPIAGLTALYALDTANVRSGSEVLITGASGGVGQFAVQLAILRGASVTAAVYRNDLPIASPDVRVVRTADGGFAALRERRYDAVIESVGGDLFTAAVESLAPDGMLVTLGATRDAKVTFDVRTFFSTGRAFIYGFLIFNEVAKRPAAEGLTTLMNLIADGKLFVPIAYRGTIDDIDGVARQLLDSRIPGKAVLRIS